MSGRIDFAALNRAALPAAPAICRRLLPDGKIVRGEFVARNPTRADRRAGSFSINLRTGKWADFASNDRGSDLIGLVAYLAGIGQGEAARRLASMIAFNIEARHG